MGLELVEIVMAVENHFGISISEEEWINIRTPGHLMTYVENTVNISKSKQTSCATQASFYKIRRMLVTKYEYNRNTITPNLTLASILPNESKEIFLSGLLEKLGIKNGPTLHFTERFERLVFYPFAFVFLVCFVTIGSQFNFAIGLVIALCLSWLPGQIICEFSNNKRTVLNPPDFTLGDLSYLLIAKENKESNQKQVEWSKAKIEQDIRAIITEVLGINSFKNEDDFIDDLGAG
jgi:acyl carrier protein